MNDDLLENWDPTNRRKCGFWCVKKQTCTVVNNNHRVSIDLFDKGSGSPQGTSWKRQSLGHRLGPRTRLNRPCLIGLVDWPNTLVNRCFFNIPIALVLICPDETSQSVSLSQVTFLFYLILVGVKFGALPSPKKKYDWIAKVTGPFVVPWIQSLHHAPYICWLHPVILLVKSHVELPSSNFYFDAKWKPSSELMMF